MSKIIDNQSLFQIEFNLILVYLFLPFVEYLIITYRTKGHEWIIETWTLENNSLYNNANNVIMNNK